MSYVLQFFIAAVATVTFAILFAAPKKELVFCGVSGGLAWLVYFILYRQSGKVVRLSGRGQDFCTFFSVWDDSICGI